MDDKFTQKCLRSSMAFHFTKKSNFYENYYWIALFGPHRLYESLCAAFKKCAAECNFCFSTKQIGTRYAETPKNARVTDKSRVSCYTIHLYRKGYEITIQFYELESDDVFYMRKPLHGAGKYKSVIRESLFKSNIKFNHSQYGNNTCALKHWGEFKNSNRIIEYVVMQCHVLLLRCCERYSKGEELVPNYDPDNYNNRILILEDRLRIIEDIVASNE